MLGNIMEESLNQPQCTVCKRFVHSKNTNFKTSTDINIKPLTFKPESVQGFDCITFIKYSPSSKAGIGELRNDQYNKFANCKETREKLDELIQYPTTSLKPKYPKLFITQTLKAVLPPPSLCFF